MLQCVSQFCNELQIINTDVSSPDVRDSATLAKHKLDLPDSYDKSLDHSQQKLNRRATRKQFLPFSKFEFQGEDELKEEIIIEHHDVDQRDPLAHDTVSQPPLGCPPSRITGRHFIERIPQTGKKAKPQRRCPVCAIQKRRRRDTIYWCPDCRVGLCLQYCFKEYHTNGSLSVSTRRS
ncbi:uncharacterized protein [Anabrus simplex]|uniref:uncharacterized protein isoform X2 n=1 Tax=Anabrus simplex TaxID=316456 RepID=UPI0035A35961